MAGDNTFSVNEMKTTNERFIRFEKSDYLAFIQFVCVGILLSTRHFCHVF